MRAWFLFLGLLVAAATAQESLPWQGAVVFDDPVRVDDAPGLSGHPAIHPQTIMDRTWTLYSVWADDRDDNGQFRGLLFRVVRHRPVVDHAEHHNIRQRLEEAKEFALKIGRDVPLFWGIGDHGGGPDIEDLEIINRYIAEEKSVQIVHRTTENLFSALTAFRGKAHIIEGDLQHVFTGCYSSLSRVKRRAAECSSALIQSEALRAATWFLSGQRYPAMQFDECWRDAMLNDFHDVITGTCIEPAEKDALDLYGKVADRVRHLRLDAAFMFNKGKKRKTYIPLTVLNANVRPSEKSRSKRNVCSICARNGRL